MKRERPESAISQSGEGEWGLPRGIHWVEVCLLSAMVVFLYVLLLSTPGGLGASKYYPFDNQFRFVFNSMIAHLMRGEFFVDPSSVKDEGFFHDGHVYAYWGIWCALIRLPLWLVHRLDRNVQGVSCLVAVCVAVAARVRTLLFLRRQVPASRGANLAFAVMLAYLLLGGSAIAYLRQSVYQEVILWAVVWGAIFDYLAIKGLVLRRFDVRLLSGMALCAGLALLTRVSTALGLYFATALLLIVLAAQQARESASGSRVRSFLRVLANRRVLFPAAILAFFCLVTGAINYFRWGNPATFSNYNLYLMYRRYPSYLQALQTHQYGVIDFRRIPYGLLYYFVPVMAFQGSDGEYLLESTRKNLLECVGMPLSSFFLTDLVPLVLIAFLAACLWKRRANLSPRVWQAASLAAGLLACIVIALSFLQLDFRYRMEFYPEFDLLAFLGLYLLLRNGRSAEVFFRWRAAAAVVLAVSVVSSFMALALYKLSSYAGYEDATGRKGLVAYYMYVVKDPHGTRDK